MLYMSSSMIIECLYLAIKSINLKVTNRGNFREIILSELSGLIPFPKLHILLVVILKLCLINKWIHQWTNYLAKSRIIFSSVWKNVRLFLKSLISFPVTSSSLLINIDFIFFLFYSFKLTFNLLKDFWNISFLLGFDSIFISVLIIHNLFIDPFT